MTSRLPRRCRSRRGRPSWSTSATKIYGGGGALLDQAGCRIVTRLKSNTPFERVEDRPVPPGSSILSDRTGYLPKRLAASRRNPMPGLVREIRVIIETGKVLSIFAKGLFQNV